MVLEFVDLPDELKLKHKISELPFQDRAKILLQLAEGLNYIHCQNILHRDIKHPNILINREKIPKICDFGIAKVLATQEERRYSICGTPNYIAPEIFSQKGYGLECDIWSFGCLTYLFEVGKTPFEGKEFRDIAKYITKGNYNREALDGSRLSCIIKSCLSIDPSQRPNAIELRDMFTDALLTETYDTELVRDLKIELCQKKEDFVEKFPAKRSRKIASEKEPNSKFLSKLKRLKSNEILPHSDNSKFTKQLMNDFKSPQKLSSYSPKFDISKENVAKVNGRESCSEGSNFDTTENNGIENEPPFFCLTKELDFPSRSVSGGGSFKEESLSKRNYYIPQRASRGSSGDNKEKEGGVSEWFDVLGNLKSSYIHKHQYSIGYTGMLGSSQFRESSVEIRGKARRREQSKSISKAIDIQLLTQNEFTSTAPFKNAQQRKPKRTLSVHKPPTVLKPLVPLKILSTVKPQRLKIKLGELEISKTRELKITFLKEGISLQVSSDGEKIVVLNPQQKSESSFTLSNLPGTHYKHYMYALQVSMILNLKYGASQKFVSQMQDKKGHFGLKANGDFEAKFKNWICCINSRMDRIKLGHEGQKSVVISPAKLELLPEGLRALVKVAIRYRKRLVELSKDI